MEEWMYGNAGLGGYMNQGSPGWISSGHMGGWGRIGAPQQMGYAPPPEYGFNAMGPGQYDLERPMGPDLPPEMGGPPVRDPSRPVTDYLPGSGIEYQRGGIGPVEAFANTRYLQERAGLLPDQMAELDRRFEAQRGAITARQDAIRQLGPRALHDEMNFQRALEYQQARYSQQQRNKIAQIEAAEQLIKTSAIHTPEEKQKMLMLLGLQRADITPSQIVGPVDKARLQEAEAMQKRTHAETQSDFKNKQADIATKAKEEQAKESRLKARNQLYSAIKKELTVDNKFGPPKVPKHEEVLAEMWRREQDLAEPQGGKPGASSMGRQAQMTPEQTKAASELEQFRRKAAAGPLSPDDQERVQQLLRQYDGQ